MYNFIMKYFQKAKWNILAKKNAHYYINSALKEKNENKYKESGLNDVKKLIIDDEIIKKKVKFSESVILEIGCGNGRMTDFMTDYFKTVYAIDISSEMIVQARERVPKKNVIFLVSDGESFEVPDNCIDIVFSWIVFQHFSTKKMVERNIQEIYRVLKPGGIAKIQLRGKKSFGGLLRFLKWYYGVSFNKEEASKMISEFGFNILSVSGAGNREMEYYFEKPL